MGFEPTEPNKGFSTLAGSRNPHPGRFHAPAAASSHSKHSIIHMGGPLGGHSAATHQVRYTAVDFSLLRGCHPAKLGLNPADYQ